jgi:3-hydroxyisobutyrate dehydrogenase-like beta-hydroxyacid dehydrogenase
MKAGLEPQIMIKAIRNGGSTLRMFEVWGPLMVSGRYDQATRKVDNH